ncbi:hypothetical protein G9A89_018161 [Geosiphon pyriformis]|nr:hypothetical protein G9A89_018161 [Geosiphon pyriformis]
MGCISFNDLFSVFSDLFDGKAAGLLGISNELWKNCDKSVLDMLLVLINSCLSSESVSSAWKETACKILSKILSDRILLVCNKFDVLYGDNFFILKGTTMQSLIFAIVLQNMRKTYDSVGWEHLKKSLVRIKMCDSFIHFFKGIHEGCTNWVITDFGLIGGYYVYNVKRQKSVCGYRLVSHYILKNGYAESRTGLSSFLVAGAFVDDMIWVESSQTTTQHILDVASKFYRINNISINNNKTVAISINCHIDRPSFFISGVPIIIAKKGEFYYYLGIFLLTKSFSKPSLAKTHLDVRFFSNMVLKKAVSDKQFLYLLSAVLYLIVSFRTQFNFIPVGVCHNLKLKSGLLSDFPGNTIHHPSFYDLKFFIQIQSEGKVTSLICFANSSGVLVLCWHSVHPLCFSVCIHVSPSNNFLVGLVCILLENSLSLGGYLGNSFLSRGGVPMSAILSKSKFFKFLPSLWWHGIVFVNQIRDHHGLIFDWLTFKQWKRLDPCGPILEWFRLSTMFLNKVVSFLPHPSALDAIGLPSIISSQSFNFIHSQLSLVVVNAISVYTDRSFKGLGTSGYRASTGVFFKDIELGLDVSVLGLMSSTLAEMQAIALTLECVSPSSSVRLFSDSQSVLDACKSKLGLICPDFCN